MRVGRILRALLPLALCLGAAGCDELPPVPREVTSEEYAVFDAVLSGGYLVPIPTGEIVVGDSALIPPASEFETHADDVRSSGVPTPVARDFHRRNQSPAPLRADRFAARLPVRLVSRTSLDSIFRAKGDGWRRFYTRFPGSSGTISLSRVGFSADGTVAVLTVDHVCGFLCGEGHVVRLERRDGRWRVVDSQTTWVS